MEDYVSWVTAEAVVPTWLLRTTPAGLFILTEMASSPIWVTGKGSAVRLSGGPEKYIAWDLSEDDYSYSGVHVGTVKLVLDPIALSSGAQSEIGDLVIRNGIIHLVTATGQQHSPRRLIEIGPSSGEKLPYAVTCSKWALLLADYEGEDWPIFQHGADEDA